MVSEVWEAQEAPPIVIGYPWSLDLQADADRFPEGIALKAQFREEVESATLLTEITTQANGGILMLSNRQIRISLTEEQTKTMSEGNVETDLIRTDLTPPSYLYIQLSIPVHKPVTRV